MRTAFRHRGERWKRGTAALAAVILLLIQSLGVAHFHPLHFEHKYAADAVASADSGICAVCLFRFHSPTVSAVAPSLKAPAPFAPIEFVAHQSRLCSPYASSLFGRAPPASL